MSEDMRLVAGRVIVSPAIPVPQTQEDELGSCGATACEAGLPNRLLGSAGGIGGQTIQRLSSRFHDQ